MTGRYKAYPEYRHSDVSWCGDVPIHWKDIKFKWVIEEKKKTSNPALPSGSISFGKVIYKNENSLAPETKASYQEVLSGELLINPLNLNFDLKSLRTALSTINVVVSTGYIVGHISKKLNSNYMRWVMHQFDVSHMKTMGSGVRQTINFTDIGNSTVSIAPINEQQKIASFLDHETAKIDTLIAKQEKLIELLKEKRQAVISHAVTKGLNPNAPMRDSGVKWLGEVPEHWSVIPNKRLFELTPKKSQIESRKKELCNFIPMDKLKQDYLALDEERLISTVFDGYTYFEDGDVLMAKVTPCFENKNMVVARGLKNGIGFGSSEIYVLRCNSKVSNDFIYYRLQEDTFMNIATAAMTGAGGLKRVPADMIMNFILALPPLEEQLKIVEALKEKLAVLDELSIKAFNAINLIKERKVALISAAVTGKIDVRDFAVEEN
tara:strand:- start:465 stop:1769 length:1305 start_codon:yes stop_codon:yes gene_type:complete